MFGRDLQFRPGMSWRGKLAYRFLGEMYVGDLVRSAHVFRRLRRLGLPAPGTRVLDAGCGLGAYAFAIARQCPGAQVVGIDESSELIRNANVCLAKSGLTNLLFFPSDITQIQDVDTYDLVLQIAVLEHIEDDIGALRALRHAMRPGGILLIEVPKDVRYAKRYFFKAPDHPDHVRPGYLPAQIHSALKAAGFEIEEIAFLFGPLASLAWEIGQVFHGSARQFLIYPFTRTVAFLDSLRAKRDGNGLLITAKRM